MSGKHWTIGMEKSETQFQLHLWGGEKNCHSQLMTSKKCDIKYFSVFIDHFILLKVWMEIHRR